MKNLKNKITKTVAIKKVTEVKPSANSIKKAAAFSVTKFIKSLVNFTEKYVYSIISKKYLLLYYSISRILIKTLVVTNIFTAIIIYLAPLMEINHQFTWDLALVLILGSFYFFKDVMFDLTNKIYSTIRNLFEKLINYLNDVKHNVDKTNLDKFNNQIKDQIKENKNSIFSPAKDAYGSLSESGKLDDIQPKAKSGYISFKTILIITSVAAILGFMYIGWNNYEDLTPILQKTYDILIAIPKIVLWKIPKKIFWDIPKKFVYD